jgi:ATP-dependent helicase STH1/SNF2
VLEAQIEEEEMEGDYTDAELNEILARGDTEFELFQQMDNDRRRDDEAHWKAHHPGEPMPERLIQEWELPPIYRKEYKIQKKTAQEEERELFDESGSRRKRTAAGNGNVHYDDGLTEEQFLEAVEGEDGGSLQDAMEEARKDRKRGRQTPNAPSPFAGGSEPKPRGRPRKKAIKDESDDDNDDDEDFSDASSAPSVQGKKRGRRSTASVGPSANGDDDSDNPRKRRKVAGKNAVQTAGNEMKAAMKTVRCLQVPCDMELIPH